jgi:hypothetical protein
MESMQEILPSGGLANFHNEVSRLADLGRYEDAYIVHAAEGETVVPMEVFDSNPGLKEMLFNQMREMGIQPERYIVGSEFNSINPITGQPEFFLKKIFKEAKKALKKIAPYAGMIAGVAGLGPGYAALIGAGVPLLAGQGAGEALMGGLGGYGAGRAFGTADYAKSAFGGKGLPGVDILGGTDNPYIFSKAARDEGIFKTLGSNLGFGSGPDAQLSKAIETKALPEGTTLENITSDQLTRLKDLQKTGLLPNPSQAITSLSGSQIATVAALGVPIYQALKAEQDNPTGMTMEDITGKYPWYGEFSTTQAIDPITGNPMGMAEGGIVQHFQDGPGEYGVTAPGQFGVIYPEGDTDFDASDIINQSGDESIQDLDLFMSDDMAANELSNMPMPQEDTGGITEVASLRQPMITVYDVVQERMVTIPMIEYLQNRGRYATQEDFDTRPGYSAPPDDEQEGFQYDFDGKTYNFDEPLTEERRQDFLERLKDRRSKEEELGMADGGIAYLAEGSFPRRTGEISGPGGPKDDRVPAMLSDGEFVMTAEAVRNAGGGSRRQGAKKMYQLMNRLEGTA